MSEPTPHTGPNPTLVLVLAIGSLIGGIAVWVLDSSENMLCGLLVRTGLVLFPLWLVLPAKGKAPPWAKLTWFRAVLLAGSLAVIAWRPFILLPIFGALFLLSMFSWGNQKK